MLHTQIASPAGRRLQIRCSRGRWPWPAGITAAGYRLRHWQITSPQFFRVWQFVEIAQTEVIEEKLCRLVKERSPRDFGASGDFHQAALHQRLQHAIDVHAAHRFYVRTRNRLA